ncbi:hypothetical protein HOP39_10530 [Vibrio coralliilyticus]|nr:hypothetical protein [Vibrio coralliilyticus]
MKLIVFEGIMESQFSKISFIINISQRSEFASKPSIEVYKFIYELVDNTPSTLKNWIEEKDFSMSRDVLALLSRSTR